MNFLVVQWLGFRVFTVVAWVQNLIEELCHTLSWHNQKKKKARGLLGPSRALQASRLVTQPHPSVYGTNLHTGLGLFILVQISCPCDSHTLVLAASVHTE